MGQQVKGFPQFPQHDQTVAFGNRRYKLVFTWRQRALSWYFDLFTADDTPVVLGRRFSASWAPLVNVGFEVNFAPEGLLYIRGIDGYLRDDLGGDLVLLRYDTDELPVAPVIDPVVVT